MSTKIIFLIGVLIIAVSTVGLGANFNTAIDANKIGSDDNISVPVPEANITNVVLTESASTITSATITIKNTDSISHSYKICIITKAGVLISDTPGTLSDCSNTTSISSSNTGSAVINFANPLSSSAVDYSNISIQEIV